MTHPVAYRPAAGGAGEAGSTGPAKAPVAADPGLMPDLRGASAREAATSAARLGLIVELKGSGQVVTQTPEPGSEIEAGMTCVLQLGGEPAAVGGRAR
jgi:PASTA domain-containing protein